MISAYNTVMVGYTKNTGDDNGDDAAINIWQEWEDADILNYDKRLKNTVYLTVVQYKMYDFLLVVAKEGVAAEF